MPVRATIEIPSTSAAIQAAVTGLALVSLSQMRARPLPPLYSGRVRYLREPARRERWQTAAETAQRGVGDCEDLAAYRVAELWRQGEKGARVVVRRINPQLMHVYVARADGTKEDPSKRLGMKGAG